MGAPSFRSLAVIAISPMPPGVVASTAVATAMPLNTDIAQPNSAATAR